MQQALQNPHFKKIWEKINWPIRHPEANSLEEALKMEFKHETCLCIFKIQGKEVLGLQVEYWDWYYQCIGNSCSDEELVEILGRPITLEDIMLLLPKNFAFWNLYSSIVEINIGNSCQPVTGYNLNWQLTKYLPEQTPETWETIAYFGRKYLI